MSEADQSHLDAWRWAYQGSTSRVLLVGEDNPQSADPRHALYCYPEGCAGNRLQSNILQLSASDYLGMWRTNLCCPTWGLVAARKRANELLSPRAPWNLIIMMGRKVTSAFDKVCAVGETPAFSYYKQGPLTLLHLPHPSGRNLIWNSEASRSRARCIVSLLVPELQFGMET